MISFLCPTRGRPKQAIDLYKSFINTQSNKNELLFCIQKEDILYQEYINVFKINGISKYFTSESMPTSYLWNQMAFSAKGDLLTLIGDDVEILTKGWDEKIEAEAKKYKDNINKAVVHCFTGDKSELKSYIDMDCYIGITGWISDLSRGKHLHDLIKYIPEDRLMIETDSPYLIPHNLNFKHKGVNEPSFLNFVAFVSSSKDIYCLIKSAI